MPYTILIKRNATPGIAPTPASLSLGELALNTGDGLLYYLDGSGSYSGTIRAINADTASYATTALSASYAPGSPSISASYAETSSYALVAQTLLGSIVSASFAITASYALSGGSGGSGVTGGQVGRLAVYTSITEVSSSRLIATGSEFLALNVREFIVSGNGAQFVAESPIDSGFPGFFARETFAPNDFGAFFGYDANNNRTIVGSRDGSTTIVQAIRFNRGSNNIEIVGSGTLIRNVQYVWPSVLGASGTVLAQDGAGNLSWVVGSGGGSPEVSGTVGTFGIFSGTSFVTGSSLLFVSNSLVHASGGFVISGTTLQVNGLSYSWPASYGISGSVLSQNAAGELDWVVISAPPSVSSSYAETASFAVSAAYAPGGGTSVSVDDDDVPVTANLTRLNFTGAGVIASLSGSVVNVAIPGGDGSGSISRTSVSFTTPSINVGSTLTGSLSGVGKTFVLFSVLTSTHSRIRLYGSSSFRDADVTRPIGTDPSTESGVIVDLVLSGSTSLFNFALSPIVNGVNLDNPAENTSYYTITNLNTSSTTIDLTFNRVILEA